MSDEHLYIGREQTLIKHFILRKYLERFAHIVGTHWDTLTYVDCFSGPWKARSESFGDTSFAICLEELRKARDTHAEKGRRLSLRCFFLEKEAEPYAQLETFAKKVSDVEVKTHHGKLEDSVKEILDFVQAGGRKSFPFIFIDPTGWTGFGMDTITPLLRLSPGEVLINFMMGHIRRFLESPQDETFESFKRLFGSGEFKEKVQGLRQQDREDAAVEDYMRAAKSAGGFGHACSAIVLEPETNKTHFNLIYLTRHTEGVQVFKDIERKAMEVQEAARAEAQQRKRVSRRGQPELFGSKDLHDSTHYESLRERYLAKARNLVLGALQTKRRLPYDDAWIMALSEPLSWESDLKAWIEEWKHEGLLAIEGMQERQRVPRRGEQNLLIWK